LTVVEISGLRLRDAELAFLSACSTADAGGRIPDEAIHLASAFQLAGYRHVIATLWPIADKPAVQVSEDVYRALRNEAHADGAARALHAAVRDLRARLPYFPSIWSSYVHYGP
jgi:CHAT domain-containing protein